MTPITAYKDNYWKGIVDYYYANIQNDSHDISIWKWLENTFNCRGSLHVSNLYFHTEEGFTAFKLTIPKTKQT